jgi:hypothetical protein
MKGAMMGSVTVTVVLLKRKINFKLCKDLPSRIDYALAVGQCNESMKD